MMMKGIEQSIVSESINLILKFVKLIVMIFIIAHWIACLLYSVGENQFDTCGDSWLL